VPCRQRDRYDEANNRFSQFCECAKNLKLMYINQCTGDQGVCKPPHCERSLGAMPDVTTSSGLSTALSRRNDSHIFRNKIAETNMIMIIQPANIIL
jgi:hypothetical protein